MMYQKTADQIAYVAGRWPLDPEKPTILFVHGAGGTSALWEHQVDSLGAHLNTIAVDLPGHGKSGGPGLESVEDYSAAVSDFIEAAGIPAPIPCGLSMGGAIVLQLVLEQQERFRAAILANTGARLRVLPSVFEAIKNDYRGFLNALPAFAASGKTDPRRLASFIAESATCPPEVAHGDFTACDRFNVMGRLGTITTPVLVLTAEDDKLTLPKYGSYLKEQMKNASIAEIKEAGHLSPLEQPEAFNRAVLDYLKEGKFIS